MTTEITDLEFGIFIGMIIILSIVGIAMLIFYILIKIDIRNKRKKIFKESINNSINIAYKNQTRIETIETTLEIIKINLDNLKTNIIKFPK